MQNSQTTHSEFGGTWLDRADAELAIESELGEGRIDDYEADLLRFWVANGFVVLPGAVDRSLCDALASDVAGIWSNGSSTAIMQDPTASPGTGARVDTTLAADKMRLVDLYGCSSSALEVLTAPTIVRFLELVFKVPALLFQGLTFEKGSGQGLHQDTAYVVVDRPLEMAAAWIALEDVVEGSGELNYLVGSHRLPDYKFSGAFKHWDPGRDGLEQHDEWARFIIRKSEEMGFQRKSFLPRKGDVLVWSADLVHGGGPISDPSLTRRSMVGHYCPVSCTPHYFTYLPDRLKVSHGRCFVSSGYYDVRNLPVPGQVAAVST